MKNFKIKDKITINNKDNFLYGKSGVILDIDSDSLLAKVKICFNKDENKFIIDLIPLEDLEYFEEENSINEKFIRYIKKDSLVENYTININLNAGAAFINKEGKFIQSSKDRLHKEIAWDLLDEDPNRQKIIDDAESEYEDPGYVYMYQELIEKRQYIRVNSGNEYEDRSYVSFEQIHKPTLDQYEAVEKFLNYIYDNNINDRSVEIYCDGSNIKTYDLNYTLAEDVIKRIKRFYTTGKLLENLEVENYIEQYLYSDKDDPSWFFVDKIAKLEDLNESKVIADAKQLGYKVYSVFNNNLSKQIILNKKCNIQKLYKYYSELFANIKIKEV